MLYSTKDIYYIFYYYKLINIILLDVLISIKTYIKYYLIELSSGYSEVEYYSFCEAINIIDRSGVHCEARMRDRKSKRG